MSEDSPKIVGPEMSPELSEFLSETDFPSETGFLSEAELQQRGPSASEPESASASGRLAPADTMAGPTEAVAARTVSELESAPAPDGDTVENPRAAGMHVGPARVADFRVRSQTPAAVAFHSLAPGPVTLVELIERHGGFDWREAVAVIHQICLYLRDHAPQTPILLDPRNIQITDKGEVQLLSGQTSSDPLVIQVGRLLRTMLMGKDAPPELRLLLAQATFELPIFESIEDVDRALAQLHRLDEPGPAGLALLRAVAAPPPPTNPKDDFGHPPPIRSILPVRNAQRRSRARNTGLGSLFGSYASHVAIIFAAIAAIGGILLTRPAVLFPKDAPSTAALAAPVEVATPPLVAPERSSAETATLVPAAPRPPIHRPPSGARDRPGVVVATPLDGRATEGNPPRHAPNPARPTATAGIDPTPPSPRDSQRRATSLLAQGQAAEAAMAFDSLVMSNPLFDPRAGEWTPEALAAFRTSQRQLLPVIAQRTYDRGKAALNTGDADRALALGKEAKAILDRRLADTPAELRAQVQDLIEQATAAAALANEIVYSEADADVVAPRALSRQMPVTGPIGVPPHRVGWLDMIIDRDGSVFFVKLNTPLNRHHERMIVSPAKAWRYRPATKNGKPVMYRIRVKVNLPESGTDF
jgi:hypothetical protein